MRSAAAYNTRYNQADLVTSRMRQCAAAAGLLLLLVAVYWKLVLPGPRYVWFDHYDMCQLEVPRLIFIARSIHEGRFPLWDPHVWAGLPVIGAAQPGAVYPLNLLFELLPLDGGTIPLARLNWLFLAMHSLGAWFFYLLCRDQGLSRPPSLAGAISFSCAGYFGSVPWLDVGNGICWTPMILLFAMRLWRGRQAFQSAVLLGVTLGLCWLSGHHEVPLIISYTVLFGSLTAAVRRWRVLAWTALALALGAAISAVQTLPLYEFGRQAARWVGAPEPIRWNQKVPYASLAQYSLPWKGIAGLLAPGVTPEGHTTAFVGLTIAVLAVLALRYRWRDPAVRTASYIGLGGLVYALGASTPIHKLLYLALPMLDKARNPVRGLSLVTLAVSLLAAFGFEVFAGKPKRALTKTLAAAALIALVVLEAGTVTRMRIVPLDRKQDVCATALIDHRDLAARLRSESGLGRIAVDREAVMTSLGDLYGFDQLQSFVAAVPANALRHELHTARTQALFGVTHSIGRTLVRKPSALPRAWIAHAVLRVKEDGELRAAVQNPALDLARTAVMLAADTPALEACAGPEEVIVRRPDPSAVVLDSTLRCRGLVVLSDVYYPGWAAWLDGQPAPLYEAYGVFRSVIAPAGQHRIEMRYQPDAVRRGLILTLAGAAASLLSLLLAHFRQKPHS